MTVDPLPYKGAEEVAGIRRGVAGDSSNQGRRVPVNYLSSDYPMYLA